MRRFLVMVLFVCVATNVWGAAADRRISDNDGQVLDLNSDGSVPVTGLSGAELEIEGGDASGAAVAANPVTVGLRAETTVPTAVDDGDNVAADATVYGEQRIAGFNRATEAIDVNPVAQEPIGSGYVQVIDETLDDSPTKSTSSAVFVGDKKKVSFLVQTVESGSGSAWGLSVEGSADNSNWVDVESLQVMSGATVSTLPYVYYTATDDQVVWLPIDQTHQYLRVTGTGYGTTGSNKHAVDVWLQYQK